MNYDSLKLENQLCFPLYACSRQIIKMYKPYLDPLGITYTQYITLMALWEKDNVTVKDLGKLLYLDSGTLTPVLKKLECQGIILRQRCQQDERNVNITLTKKGIELKDKAVLIPSSIASCLTLSSDDAIRLHSILHDILKQSKTDSE